MRIASAPIQASPPSQSLPLESLRFPTAKQFFLVLVAYFGLQVIARTIISEAVGIDEADQLVRGQTWSWGYGPQAPLYTWLMTLFLRVFGSSIFSLTLLRELMLFGIYVLTYWNARTFARSHLGGMLAAASLQFHPSIVWESQRELTHSIAASLMVLAALLALQHCRKDGWLPWIVFGVCCGFATLSKYNAALICAALLIAAATIPSLRLRLLGWPAMAAIAVPFLIVLPNGIWMLHHRAEASGSMYKLGIHEATPWTSAFLTGVWVWTGTLFLHVAPLVIFFAVLFWPSFIGKRHAISRNADEVKWLWRAFLILNGLVILSIAMFKVTAFKDRWLQPLLIWMPLLLILRSVPGLKTSSSRVFLTLAGVVTIVMTVVGPCRLMFTEWRGRRDVLNAPFARFASDLEPLTRDSRCIVTDNYWLAGNLSLRFPRQRVYSLDLSGVSGSSTNCLLIWEVRRRDDIPPLLLDFATQFSNGKPLPPPTFFEEKWKYHRSKLMRLGVLRFEQ